ncbi:hypothetical protein CEP51_005592 [Fusarium floridanum]|uniref:Heterokaryon incompatibility domain-containing protein n=1 Tax=Fusarium floridanum TaxID=1325733 RepID=A0A428RW93_9HYPO|nr:hypothetical protein CEP51_005592 [Fusarium floridanum]
MSPQTPSPEKSGQGNGSPVQGAETLARDADSVPPVASPAEFVFAQGSAVFKGVTSACLSPSTYHYAPLPEDCIRLLWLMPHENKDAPIQCQLFDYLLPGSRAGAHLYEALSYVWGSPEKTQSIFTPTGCVPVTENLHAALSRLRDGSLPRIVWADAVCINQNDTEERDRQVKTMAKIYAKASRVIVWLEETPAGGHRDAASDGDLALEEIRRAAAGTSLGQLVDMYHNREATDRRDKVYALIGMSSDVSIRADLMPDYRASWKDLFHRLIRSLVGEVASVETWDDKEIASIRSDVCVLGHISSVLEHEDDKQGVEIIFQDGRRPFADREKLRAQHTLHASAKSIQVGDVICLLQGSSTPTIIRVYDDYCAIVAIAISLPIRFVFEDENRKVVTDIRWSKYFSHVRTFSHRFLLIWDWEKTARNSDARKDYTCLLKAQPVKDDTTEQEKLLDKAVGLNGLGHVFRDSGQDEEAIKRLEKAVETLNSVPQADVHHKIATMDDLNLTYKREGGQKNAAKAEKVGVMADLLGRRGDYIKITEATLVRIAKSFDQEVMEILLDCRGNEVHLTEKVAIAAVRNPRHAKEVVKLLLDRRGGEMTITEEVAKAAAENDDPSMQVMEFLLDQHGKEFEITEEVVKAAAGNPRNGEYLMKMLVDRQRDQIPITEGVLKAAAGNYSNAEGVMRVLLDQGRDRLTITTDVWKAAVGNSGSAKAVLTLLLDLPGEQVPQDKGFLEVAVGAGTDVLDLLTGREALETHSQSFLEDTTSLRLYDQTDRLKIWISQRKGLESHLKSDFEKLYDAARYGNTECIEELVSQEMHTATPGDQGQTALWIAARHGHEEIVELLARLPDAKTNNKPRSEQPAIFWSSWWGHERAVMALIDGGAYVGSMDKSRDTIVEMARGRGHESIAQILESSQRTSVLLKDSQFWG